MDFLVRLIVTLVVAAGTLYIGILQYVFFSSEFFLPLECFLTDRFIRIVPGTSLGLCCRPWWPIRSLPFCASGPTPRYDLGAEDRSP